MMETFCKVAILCHQDSPNWLGWLVIGIAVVLLINVYSALVRP